MPANDTNVLHFSSSTNSCVEVLNLSIPAEMTVEAWIRPNSVAGSMRMIVAKDRAGDGANQFRLCLNPDGRVAFVFPDNNILSGAPVAAGVWTHVAATRSGDAISIYVNGVLSATSSVTAKDVLANNAYNFRIGARVAGGGVLADLGFDGAIGDVRLWDVARTGGDIAADMGYTVEPSHSQYKNLIGYWRLNEGSGGNGSTVADTKGQRPGTLHNGPTWIVGSPIQSQRPTKLGPVGSMDNATAWEVLPKASVFEPRISGVTTGHNWSIGSVSAQWEDAQSPAPPMKPAVSSTTGFFEVPADDYLVAVHVGHGKQHPGASALLEIITLQYETRKGLKSPVYGGASGQSQVTTYSLRAPDGQQIIGFFGANGGAQNVPLRIGVHLAQVFPRRVPTRIGPVGSMENAKEFEILPKPGAVDPRISGVTTGHSWSLANVSAQYDYAPLVKPTVTSETGFFEIPAGDHLVAVHVGHGRQYPGYPDNQVITVQYETRKGLKSPVYGGQSGSAQVTNYSLRAPDGHQIIGFFGASQDYQNIPVRIGVHLAPIPPVVPLNRYCRLEVEVAGVWKEVHIQNQSTANYAQLMRSSGKGNRVRFVKSPQVPDGYNILVEVQGGWKGIHVENQSADDSTNLIRHDGDGNVFKIVQNDSGSVNLLVQAYLNYNEWKGVHVYHQQGDDNTRLIRHRGNGNNFRIVAAEEIPDASKKQSISGVVNGYAGATEITGDTIKLGGNVNPFRQGDRVVVVQMTGATIDTSNTEKFGTITAHNGAGRYAWGTVASVTGQDVKLAGDLSGFDAKNGKVQVVRASSYPGDVAVTGRVDAPEWNGSAGGVIAIESSGTIEIAADVDASAKGFGGGAQSSDSNKGTQRGYTYAAAAGAGSKGAGIGAMGPEHVGGRGAAANGGGGGNEVNAGGGGGGNGGAGGLGGIEWSGGAVQETGGVGGRALDFSDRVFMGGGGGGGQQNNAQGSAGGNGGGIILLRAQAITGAAGARVRANGGHGGAAAADGAGGGGAGGTIILDTASLQGTFTVEAKGGNGGDAASDHGPGGGGGGGAIRTNAVISPTLTTSVVNGNSGLAGGKPRGATNGEKGILASLTRPADLKPTGGTIEPVRKLTGAVVRVLAKDFTAATDGTVREAADQAGTTVHYSAGVGFLQWSVTLPQEGKWYLHGLMRAGSSRPCTLTINSVQQSETILGNTTGDWSSSPKWFVYGPFDFKQGSNTFRIDYGPNSMPHLKEFAFSESMIGIAPVTAMAKALKGSNSQAMGQSNDYSNLTGSNDRTTFFEWNASIPRAGKYYLHALMTAQESRPCSLSINGAKQDKPILGEVTGGWYSDKLKWFTYGPYDLKQGDNLIRIDGTSWLPHLREFALTPDEATADGGRVSKELLDKIADLESKLAKCGDCEVKLAEHKSRLDGIDDKLIEQAKKLVGVDELDAAQNKKLATLEEKIAAQDKKLAGVDEKIAAQDKKLAGVDEKIAAQDKKLAGVDEKIAAQDKKLAGVDEKIAAQDKKLAGVDELNAQQDKKLANVDEKIAAQDRKLIAVDEKFIAQKRLVDGLEEKANKCGDCDAKLTEQGKKIAELVQKNTELATLVAELVKKVDEGKKPEPPKPPTQAQGSITLRSVNIHGDEYVEIACLFAPMDLSGYRVTAFNSSKEYVFPAGARIEADSSIRVYTNKVDPTTGGHSFGNSTPIWRKEGDIARLYNAAGILLSETSYGAPPAAPEPPKPAAHVRGSIAVRSVTVHGEEYAEIICVFAPMDLSGYRLRAVHSGQEYVFPVGARIEADSIIRVHTNKVDPTTGGHSFGSSTPIWRKEGDVARLFNGAGILLSEHAFGAPLSQS